MKTTQTFMKFVDNEETEEADLYIYGDIVDFAWWEDEVSATDIRNKLNNTNAKTINVHINSLGGDTFTGIAIYNLLREKSKTSTIVCYVDSIAASAASIIAMAGDKIIMPANTLMMIHNCWTITVGNADDLRKTATDMDKVMEAVIQCYLSRVKISEEELKSLLDAETYLTASEALEKGFCDEVLELNEKSNSVLSSLSKIIKDYKTQNKKTSKIVNETNIIISNKIDNQKNKNESVKETLFNLK